VAVHGSAQRGGETLFSDGFEPALVSRASFEWRVLERLTYGATPDEADAFVALGANDSDRLSAWLDGQLAPDTLDDSACGQRIAAAGFATLDKTVAQLWADHIRGTAPRGQPVSETQAARLIRAVCSRRQLYERMVEFWHDHFNVYGWDFTIQALFGHYDASVIRPNALGNFRTLLEQVARSPAMLFYLDNKSSRGSDFNENFARELLELHTMGVAAYFPTINPFEVPTDADGPVGYCDNDVYEAARAFTGWTLADDHWEFPDTPAFDTGEFLYYADWHDVAGKLFLQTFLVSNQPALKDGRDVLDLLAAHPATARHVCRKLAVALVSDDPPQELVDGAAALFRAQWQAPDQIAQVVRFLIESPAAFDAESGKRRRPFEHIVAMLRKTGAEPVPVNLSDWNPWGEFFHRLRQTGHGPFRWRTPDGFPDVASAWETTSVMGQTWRLLSRLPQLDDGAGDPILPILDVTRAALAPSARTPVRLVDFWLDRVLGRAPLDARRQELIDFMRQNGPSDQVLDLDTDAPFGFWSSSDLSQHYNGARLNAMVGLAFMLPEAHQR
jgi:uncharacterized protein (DUF1800 family)